jgi:hypothetical protein
MHTLNLTEKQLVSLNQVLHYLFEGESEDFIQEHGPEDFTDTQEVWEEIDDKIMSGELDPPHIYCSAVRVWRALRDQEKLRSV